MQVPRQSLESADENGGLKGAAARTHALMVATASEMLQRGLSPSVSEVAEAAGVSRSTAYRYFPTLADMLRAVVAEALGPIFDLADKVDGDEPQIDLLFRTTYMRLFAHQATFRAALRQSLEAGAAGAADASLGRGHRRELLARALGETGLSARQLRRLLQALSLTYGVEAMIVLKDIWNLDEREAHQVAIWAAHSLIKAAMEENAGQQ